MPKAGKKSEPAPSAGGPAGLPKLGRRSNQDKQQPKIPPKPPFWLVFCPGRYCVMDGRVVPALNEYQLVSGSNGVLQLEDGTLLVDGAEENLRSKGATPIPWDIDDEPYLRQCAPNVWVSRWTRTTNGSEHMEPDLIGYAAWLDGLVERGIIPGPQLHDLDKLASSFRFDIEKSSENPAVHPHRVRQLREQLAVVEAEIEPAREAHDAQLRAELAQRQKRSAAREASVLPKVAAPGTSAEDAP